MKKIYLFLLACCLTTLNLRADLIWQELFNYADGSLTNLAPTLWAIHSGTAAAPGDLFVKGHRAEVSSTTTYLGLTTTRQDDGNRKLSITNNSVYTNSQQVLYASFVINFTNLPTTNGAYFASFFVSSSTLPGRLWALTGGPLQPTNNFVGQPNTFRLGLSSAAAVPYNNQPNAVCPIDLALNTDYQVVLGYNPTTGNPDLADDTVSIWINPIGSADPKTSTQEIWAPGTTIANGFALRQASGFGGFVTISNLVLATTFMEAFTNVLPTNAVAPKIVIQPVGATNFTGSSVSAVAIASGQGQASLTYQWQLTNALNLTPINVSNPNGNSNILSVDTTVAITNYYTLVVTTPFGLSVTSSVAKVKITDAPVPPTFTVQPVGVTNYTGQTATFSTTVIGPSSGDPVVFTWYSNSTVISVGQVDNAHSSTYTLPNVKTSYSATYKVAATNNYGGVVSSNAVLVVSNPPSVTIAFLRKLIDPVALTTTASPTQPYQVTGVVTSYTNTTTGDTSSYYLQDATAGINIFATAGSTFRPLQGDSVTFVGVLSSFTANTGGLELFADTVNRSYTSYTINSSGNALPAARVIPFTLTNDFGYLYVNTNTMGSRVTLTNVYFGVNAGTVLSTSANVTMTVTNQNGTTFQLAFYNLDLDTAGQTLPAYATSVTGNLIGFHPNVFLAVTKWSDIVVPPAQLGVSQAGNILTFSWSAAGYNLQSQTNALGTGLQPTGWFDYPDVSNPVNITIDPANPAVFYRLFHP